MPEQKVSFAKLTDNSWGVRVDGFPTAQVAPGDRLQVRKRSGETKEVVIAAVLERFNAGRSAWCSLEKTNGNGNGQRPRPVVRITSRLLDGAGDLLDSWESRGGPLGAWLEADTWATAAVAGAIDPDAYVEHTIATVNHNSNGSS